MRHACTMPSFESCTPEPSTGTDSNLRSLSLIGSTASVLGGSPKQESDDVLSAQSTTGSQQIPSDLECLFRESHVYKRLAADPEGRPIPTPELTVKAEIIQALRSGTSIKYEENQPCNAWGQYDGSLVVDGVTRYYVNEKDVQSAGNKPSQGSSAVAGKMYLGVYPGEPDVTVASQISLSSHDMQGTSFARFARRTTLLRPMAPLSLSTLSLHLSSAASDATTTTTSTCLSSDITQLSADNDPSLCFSTSTLLGGPPIDISPTDPVQAILAHKAKATPVIQIDPTLPIIPATTERPKLPKAVEEIFEGGFDFTITKQTTGSTEPPVTATTEEFCQAVAAADDIKVENSEKTYLARSAGMVVVLVAFTGSMTWIVDYCQRSNEKKIITGNGVTSLNMVSTSIASFAYCIID
ncbi:hypothetical protein FFLO_05213 [Filobasidium floriforme]|uniref:Uncharacterized protein n=1 Tax=Filobasidium floriforme TaxID=5210 RepID=A0A8K0JIL8_9TREE|nr:uncharacterized protein HD553DRAFT_322763 [Filobasidium floriforme]KAG7530165.1 hypothetical protein FFLO_05213 [Filobasidium floriforme]KAH8087254.1 hypothetical protein HD553DRAFT_322763 [Filobasidium floriforme]